MDRAISFKILGSVQTRGYSLDKGKVTNDDVMEKIVVKQGFHLIFSLSFFPGYEGQLVDFSSHDHLNKTTFDKFKKKAKSA